MWVAACGGAVKGGGRSSDTAGVKLVACFHCHAQYDVTARVPGSTFECRCGTTLEATAPTGVDATVARCSACGAVARQADEQCDYCGAEIAPAPKRGSLICPECMARNLEEARFCLACGVAFEPGAVPDETPELRCPGCERWLVACEVGGLVVRECPKCHGLWAPGDVFDSLVDRAARIARERALSGELDAPRVDGANPAESRVEYRRCPECEGLMGRRNFRKRSGVIIDRCHAHGTWLDANELERVAGFLLSGRAEQAARIERAAVDASEREAARAAMRRVQMLEADPSDRDWSVFGGRRERGAVGTILDLLNTILN